MKCWNCGHESAFLHEDADGEFWIECFDCGEHTEVYEVEEDAWQQWETKGGAMMNSESIIEELENICYNNEYILDLLSKLKNGIPVRPLPCVRDEHGEIKEQTVKALFKKVNEELDELKAAVLSAYYSLDVVPSDRPDLKNVNKDDLPRIAEEAEDTITAITTLCEALGIDAEMRDEAQRLVNEKNRSRGRL